jgi:phage terminase Nu1 subunit (DNA packaging protein)
MKQPTQTDSKSEFARLIDVSAPRVSALLRQGLPCVDGRIPRDLALRWLEKNVARNGSATESSNKGFVAARVEKTLLQIRMLQLQLAKQQSQLVTIEDIQQEWTRRVLACRTRLLAVPVKVAAMAHGASDVEAARSLIESEIHEALNEIAAEALNELADDPAAEQTRAPKQTRARGRGKRNAKGFAG